MSMAVVLLAAALGLFLASTRQMSILWRAPVWIAGAAFLLAALIVNDGDGDKASLLGSLIRHPDVVSDAFQHNWPTVDEYVSPALNILILFAALLGIGALIAFTPGEGVERILRPINIGLIGAIAGGAVVFLVSAIGFGPVAKRQVFIGMVSEKNVVDGDTLRMGDVSLRIWGIDAPEDHQICLHPDGSPYDCGAIAADVVRKLATPGPIFCRAPKGAQTRQLTESFGRPLVTCGSDQQGYGNLPDIGQTMVAMGFAAPYQSSDGEYETSYKTEGDAARDGKMGFYAGEFLSPTKWRNDPGDRCILLRNAKGRAPESDPAEHARLEQQIERLLKGCP
jgi:endonuclease YncB( thermonuclease family)